MKTRQFSHRTVMIAMDSPDGSRLEEIALEHSRIAKKYAIQYFTISHDDRVRITTRIKQLRSERDAILSKYEGAEARCSNGGSSVSLSPV